MRYKVRHVSELSYSRPVAKARFNLRLKPRLRGGQAIDSQSLELVPEPSEQEDQPGPYWVTTTQIGFDAPLTRLKVTSEFEIDEPARDQPARGPSLDTVRGEALTVRDLSELSPAPYLFASRIATMSEAITSWGAAGLQAGDNIIAAVTQLMRSLHEQFTYAPGKTTSRTPPRDAFDARHGVCQDFAHIMIMALRAHGIPAAYISGYLLTRPPPGKPRLVGADAMHAWVEVWCGNTLGWVGFDPTNNCLVSEDHIAIAMGRDYADISPIDGTFIGSAPQSMVSSVDVAKTP
jgi:transglutaminase-like putative cysteine protease